MAAPQGNDTEDTVADFIENLLNDGLDSWNTTYKIKHFEEFLGGFSTVANETKYKFINAFNEQWLTYYNWVWSDDDSPVGENNNLTSTLLEWYSYLDPPPSLLDPTLAPTTEAPLTNAQFCQTYQYEIKAELANLMLIPAMIMMVLLSFVQRRKRLRLSCLWGRPSYVFPINFVDEIGRRWAFCACFALMTRDIFDFFEGNLYWNPGEWGDPDWVLKYGWLKTFNLIGNVVQLGMMYYPLFACVSMRRMIPANILGLGYMSFWVYFDIDWYVSCGILKDPETGGMAIAAIVRLTVQVPMFIVQLALIIGFLYELFMNSRTCYLKRKGTYKKKDRWDGKETLPLQYIEYLMTHQPKSPETFKEKIKDLCTYQRIDGFKYAPRVVCTMIVAAIGLYIAATSFGIILDDLFKALEELGQDKEIINYLKNMVNGTADSTLLTIIDRVPEYLTATRWCVIISNLIAAILHIVFMILMIISYRSHVLQIMRGDRSWHYKLEATPASTLVAGMRYSGYQIAYILWGYIIMFGLLAIVSMALVVLIIIPAIHAERSFVIDKIIVLFPTVVLSLLLYYLQLILSKFVFLQERGAHLALNNRRVYHCFCFFMFFFNVVVGVFSVLKRSLLSLIFGTAIICRLDRCLLMRGFEQFDAGFKAYLGMLEVDVHHNHPIVKGFIYILKDEVEDSKNAHEYDHVGNGEKGVMQPRRIRKTIRNKWWKLITLVNNPTLVLDRLQKRVDDAKKESKNRKKALLNAITEAGEVIVAGAAFAELENITPL